MIVVKRLTSSLLTRSYVQQRTFTSTSTLADQIRVVEVGPRDGLQNEKEIVSLPTKLELIQRLAAAGLSHIEAGSFVSPRWVPQMANTSEILDRLMSMPPKSPFPVSYSFLVPNLKGMENALAVAGQGLTPVASRAASGSQRTSRLPPTPPSTPPSEANAAPITSTDDPDAISLGPTSQADRRSSPVPAVAPQLGEVSVFAAATETFSRKNVNCSINASLDRFKPVFEQAKRFKIRVRAYVSVVLGCPYEGPDVPPQRVAEISRSLLAMGADEISLGDTTGMGTAPRTMALLRTLSEAGVPKERLALHLHDTYGQALVNTAVGLEHGISVFDSSVAGLGGCPYAKGATGNVATEDLIYFLHSVGMTTGADLEQLAEIGAWISSELKRESGSRVGKAIMSRK
ncbi:MAG: hypothetical protein M1817_002579 [Caeruleum heppii]|nr:MAG: hypothetical protein M1817_002579 [Caeruleum heppii]